MKTTNNLERAILLLSRIAEAHTTAAIAVAELRAMLTKDSVGAHGQSSSGSYREHSTGRPGQYLRPVIDHSTFCVEWEGRTCCLGHRLSLKLLDRLCRRPGQYIPHEEFLHEVWEARRSPETIRSAIRELRRRLRAAEMGELADAIHGHGKCYALMLCSRG
jgi:DNA-binding response OmpR family regulator